MPRYIGLNLGRAHGDDDDAAEEVVFGFWVFMMSDVILFGLLFATYVVMQGARAGGPGPKALFDLSSAFIETMALLASSFTIGMASIALKYRQAPNRVTAWLAVTLLLAAVFLGFEIHDFVSMAAKGGVPQRSGFLSAFFALVPLHGLHVATASLWLWVLILRIGVYGLDRGSKTGLLRLAILWHFLDVVWIAIFSVVYLGGLA